MDADTTKSSFSYKLDKKLFYSQSQTDCDIVAREFELQSFTFGLKPLGKDINPLLAGTGSNHNATVHLLGIK